MPVPNVITHTELSEARIYILQRAFYQIENFCKCRTWCCTFEKETLEAVYEFLALALCKLAISFQTNIFANGNDVSFDIWGGVLRRSIAAGRARRTFINRHGRPALIAPYLAAAIQD